ncbi:SDR family oxidoreductase [Antrihabitans sp. YC3-6]|uniref:SDR family oxidoreductase n=1 Tax=Antrihabitans stalagmiti TaxID=2799499 RepID=A0A934U1K8_9NOCA|nr:SDR family oxidoreductase [Antrihabitans stalagmiti]MBJ8337503.1 SDR family oxidoreductase [Antrihabitans stalagmiti]
MTPGKVLLTGASGLVGVEVLARLVAAGTAVTAAVHSNSAFVANDGSTVDSSRFDTVDANVRRPSFGFSDNVRRALGGSQTCLVHCAATTDFGAPTTEYDELNVAGTANAIALALEWDIPFVYVSTAYVCGLRNGVIRESELDTGQRFGNDYENSKFRAELLVKEAITRGLRATVVRPSIVTGLASDGAIRDHKNLYPVVKLIVEAKLRSLPGRYDATLALVPVDHVADVITAVVHNIDDVIGTTFHAVGRDALSLRDVSDVFAEYPSFAVAKFVPPSTFSVDDLGRDEREYFTRIGSLYTTYFDRRPAFEYTNTADILGIKAPATGQEYLRLLLDSCLETGYLGDTLPSIEQILRQHGLGEK